VTPSGWHDDARGRDAGHDEMQVAVFQWFRSRKADPIPSPLSRDRSVPAASLDHRQVIFELPLFAERRGGYKPTIIAFADVAELWSFGGKYASSTIVAGLLEIKPRIDSVGALVRQCKAVERAFRMNVTPEVVCHVLPVVPYNEPKISLLRQVIRCIAWDGDHPVDFKDYTS
jgi:hypothetical protein